jgi:hypothetical protein
VPPFVVLTRNDADQERPVCNQSAAGTHWIVAFQELNNNVANDDWDIAALDVSSSGVVGATVMDTAQANDPLLHCVAPQIAGAYGRYVLSYVTRDFVLNQPKPTGPRGEALYVQRIDWDHQSDIASFAHSVVELESIATTQLRAEGIAFDWTSRSHWLATFSDRSTETFGMRKLGYTGNVVEARTYSLGTGALPLDMAPAFDADARQFPLALAVTLSTGDGRLSANAFTYEPAAPPMLVGFACGSGVWTDLDDTELRQHIGSENMPLRLANAPLDTVALLIISADELPQPFPVPGAGGCTLVPDMFGAGYLGAVTATIGGGAAEVALSLPETLSPFDLILQWAYLVPAGNPLGLQASEGLRIEVRG